MDLTGLRSANIDKLRCDQCSNYLSYFPIRTCPDSVSICGRCTLPEGTHGVENLVFQTLCQFISYPCRYKDNGCEEERQPKDVPSHEKNCPFRVVPCPFLKINGCEWMGSRSQILEHSKTGHSDLYLKEDNNLDLSATGERYYLLEHEGLLLICHSQYDFDTKIFNFDMSTNEFETTPKSYSCNLKVSDHQNRASLDFVSTSYEEIALDQLNLESFSDKAVLQITVGGVVVDPNEYIDLDMLSVLKCFLCENYATPPIYHCVKTSEVLCSRCKSGHQNSCVPCSQNVTSTRNISLDKMGSHLNYPCRNRAAGCLFVAKPAKMNDHHTQCELGPIECPLAFTTCKWQGLIKKLSAHMQDSHQVLNNRCEISKRLAVGTMTCNVVKYLGNLFRVVCKRSADKYMWSVQYLGDSDFYKYEIEIVDPARAGRRLMVRHRCEPLCKAEHIFEEGKGFSYFFADQIRDFVVDEVVVFRVLIFV